MDFESMVNSTSLDLESKDRDAAAAREAAATEVATCASQFRAQCIAAAALLAKRGIPTIPILRRYEEYFAGQGRILVERTMAHGWGRSFGRGGYVLDTTGAIWKVGHGTVKGTITATEMQVVTHFDDLTLVRHDPNSDDLWAVGIEEERNLTQGLVNETAALLHHGKRS